MAALASGIIGGIGSLFGGLFGGNASSQASQEYIQGLQKAQGELQNTENQGLQDYKPYQQAGQSATTTLSSLLATPGQGLLTPWNQTFTAPTAAQAEATPGYQFQLKQGQDAMQNSAAAKGGLLSGRTLADLNNYSQGVASTNYQNTFNNSLAQYQSAYKTFQDNQSNTYNRLLGMSQEGLNATENAGNFRANMSGDIASLYGQEGAAKAQGTMGAATSYGSILPGISSALSNYGMLSSLS